MKWYNKINLLLKTVLIPLLLLIFLNVIYCGKTEQNAREYKVGILSGGEAFVGIAEGFKKKMTELGYVEGKTIHYDLRKLQEKSSDGEQIGRAFVEKQVDLILSFPTGPSIAAKNATLGTNIPVVFVLAGLEGNQLVESVPEPGGNITGIRFPGPENTVKRLDILHELVPYAKRVFIIYDQNYPNAPSALEQLRLAAFSMGITLIKKPVTDLEGLKAALRERASLDEIGIDAILIMPEILTQTPEGFGAIYQFSKEHKIPIGGALAYTAYSGALFSYDPDNIEMGMQAAVLADKIFKGTPAGTIMVVTPNNHLRINYKRFRELGLVPNEGLMNVAKEIIR